MSVVIRNGQEWPTKNCEESLVILRNNQGTIPFEAPSCGTEGTRGNLMKLLDLAKRVGG